MGMIRRYNSIKKRARPKNERIIIMEKKLWYAVVTNNDPDWGYGSYDKEEARQMAVECANSGTYNRVDLVTVDEDGDPIAIEEENIA